METKRCTAGENCLHPEGPLLPLSEFNKDSSKKDGLSTRCKACKYARIKVWQQSHREQMHDYGKNYRNNHRDKDRERQRKWGKANRAKVSRKNRRQHRKDLEHSRRRSREWRQSHLEYDRKRSQKRRSQKRELPATFTVADWDRALKYWHGVCAYCGNPPGLFDTNSVLHQDHFVPVTKQGPYTPENILPACQTCNLGKHNSDALQWLAERFGERKAKQILKDIHAYFDWLKI